MMSFKVKQMSTLSPSRVSSALFSAHAITSTENNSNSITNYSAFAQRSERVGALHEMRRSMHTSHFLFCPTGVPASVSPPLFCAARSATGAAATSTPPPPQEVNFPPLPAATTQAGTAAAAEQYYYFRCYEGDLNYQLLEEAYFKHGVSSTVPPQRAPKLGEVRHSEPVNAFAGNDGSYNNNKDTNSHHRRGNEEQATAAVGVDSGDAKEKEENYGLDPIPLLRLPKKQKERYALVMQKREAEQQQRLEEKEKRGEHQKKTRQNTAIEPSHSLDPEIDDAIFSYPPTHYAPPLRTTGDRTINTSYLFFSQQKQQQQLFQQQQQQLLESLKAGGRNDGHSPTAGAPAAAAASSAFDPLSLFPLFFSSPSPSLSLSSASPLFSSPASTADASTTTTADPAMIQFLNNIQMHDLEYFCRVCRKGFVKRMSAEAHLLERHGVASASSAVNTNDNNNNNSSKSNEGSEEAKTSNILTKREFFHLLEQENSAKHKSKQNENEFGHERDGPSSPLHPPSSGATKVSGAAAVDDNEDGNRNNKQRGGGGGSEGPTKYINTATPANAAPGVKHRARSRTSQQGAPTLLNYNKNTNNNNSSSRTTASVRSQLNTASVVPAEVAARLRDPEGQRKQKGSGEGSGNNISERGGSIHDDMGMTRLTIREKSKRFKNPFGETVNADVLELEKEPLNPFVDWEGRQPDKASNQHNNCHETATAAAANGNAPTSNNANQNQNNDGSSGNNDNNNNNNNNQLVCPICAKTRRQQEQSGVGHSSAPPLRSFRLLDSLLAHIESAHPNDVLSFEEKQKLYAQDRYSPQFKNFTAAPAAVTAEAAKTAEDGGGKRRGAQQAEGGQADAKTRNRQHTGDGDGAYSPSVLGVDEVQVHLRSATNIACIGRVVDIQEGFVGATSVLQFVIKVADPAAATGVAATTTAAAAAPAVALNDNSDGDEHFVIRCVGEKVPRLLLLQTIGMHSFVVVNGLLRLNRQQSKHTEVLPKTNIDSDVNENDNQKFSATQNGIQSNKNYAFPYIQVMPPFGFIKAL